MLDIQCLCALREYDTIIQEIKLIFSIYHYCYFETFTVFLFQKICCINFHFGVPFLKLFFLTIKMLSLHFLFDNFTSHDSYIVLLPSRLNSVSKESKFKNLQVKIKSYLAAALNKYVHSQKVTTSLKLNLTTHIIWGCEIDN